MQSTVYLYHSKIEADSGDEGSSVDLEFYPSILRKNDN